MLKIPLTTFNSLSESSLSRASSNGKTDNDRLSLKLSPTSFCSDLVIIGRKAKIKNYVWIV